MSDIDPGSSRFKPIAAEITMEGITLTFIDSARAGRGIREVIQREIPHNTCEQEIIELIDAMEQLLIASEDYVREPPESIASRLR